ncbi:AAA family ATPase [Halobacillus sp. B23F22_1]|uniref:AAA family ATPase n=1 Tax=Halobacillus sp. B23F22_1 TaxID=3459514 RepID=UPI00373E50EA
MKIISLHIYGFGKWKDHTIHLSTHPLTVITGANEAGKSTLQQFILFILFGLPPRKRAFYQPKTGGTIGGRLTIYSEAYGEVIIERMDDRDQGEAVCWLSNGDKRGEAFLKKTLGGLSKSAYQSIYSFNAEELSKLQQLTSEEIGEVLLNIGLTGSDQIYQTEKKLEKELNEQFKPKGRNPKLNQELLHLEKTALKRNNMEKEVGDYQLILERLKKLNEDIEEAEIKREKLSRLYFSYQQMKKALPVVQQYHQLVIEEEEDFVPENARLSMRQYQDALLPLQSEWRTVRENKLNKQERLTTIEEDLLPLPQNQLQSLLEEKLSYQQHEKEATRLELQIRRANEEMEQEMNRIDLPIQKNDLFDFEFPFYLEETWRALREEDQQLVQEESQLKQEVENLGKQEDQTLHQLKNLRNMTIGEEEAVEHSELVDLYIHSNASPSKRASPSIDSKRTYGLAALLFLGGIVLSLVTSQFIPSVVALIFAIGVLLLDKTQRPTEEETGSSSFITKEMYMKARQELQQFEQAKGEAVYLHEQRKEQEQRHNRLIDRREQLEQMKKVFQKRWKEQIRDYPFLESLKLHHWEKLYHLLKQLKDKQREISNWEEEFETHSQKMGEIEEKVSRFLTEQKWEHKDKTIEEKFLVIEKFLNEQKQLLDEMVHLKQEVHLLEKQQHRLEEEIAPLRDQQSELFDAVGVLNVSEFYEHLDRYEERQHQVEKKKQIKQQIQIMLTVNEQERFHVWTLPPTDADIAFEIEKQQKELDDSQALIKQLQQERADYEHKKNHLESSDELSNLTHQFELDRTRFNERAKEWASYKIALDVLSKTKEKYQNQYLPLVFEAAQGYFDQVTLGRYKNLQLDRDQQKMMVQDRNGFYFSTVELSRGTADQLYVCLRLALAKTFSEHAAIPFLVDDGFVHFDEARLSIMLQIIQELSMNNQILLFTWRDDIAHHVDQGTVNLFQLSK